MNDILKKYGVIGMLVLACFTYLKLDIIELKEDNKNINSNLIRCLEGRHISRSEEEEGEHGMPFFAVLQPEFKLKNKKR